MSYSSRLVVGLLIALVANLTLVQSLQAAPEPCPPVTPWESLCNVEPELRRSYLLIEQVGDLQTSRDLLSGMVRDRKVTVAWDWNDFNASHLGAFSSLTREVLIPAHVRGQPDRVEAAILAHELMHAYANHVGWFRPMTADSCLQDEKLAFMVGMLYYDRVAQFSGRPDRPASDWDAEFLYLNYQWGLLGGNKAALELLADRHLTENGYINRCLRLGRGAARR